MAINVSKSGGIIYQSEQIVSLYNAPITQSDQSLYFFDSDSATKPRFSIQFTESNRQQRCLHYTLYSPVLNIDHKNHVVIFNNDGDYQVLYQTTNVAAHKSEDNYVVTFWSVLKYGMSTKTQVSKVEYDPSLLGKVIKDGNTQYVYVYDPVKIQRFRQSELQDFQSDDQYTNIFCVAQIQMQEYIVSATSSASSGTAEKVMVINMLPRVLDQQIDLYPVLDFATGGSGGGGIGQHQHIPYIDGTGYAFAVFHPGTSMPQLSWLNK